MSDDDERKRQAVHESAHAVIAGVEELGLRHARLSPEPEVITNAALNRVAWPAIEAHVKFFVAGYCADRRYAPSLASREDAENVHDFAEALRLVDEARLERLLIKTEHMIVAHWLAVQAVAAALLEHEVLSASEIYRLIIRSR